MKKFQLPSEGRDRSQVAWSQGLGRFLFWVCPNSRWSYRLCHDQVQSYKPARLDSRSSSARDCQSSFHCVWKDVRPKNIRTHFSVGRSFLQTNSTCQGSFLLGRLFILEPNLRICCVSVLRIRKVSAFLVRSFHSRSTPGINFVTLRKPSKRYYFEDNSGCSLLGRQPRLERVCFHLAAKPDH